MENELFEKTPVAKAYLKLSLPVVMSMMVSLVYNMVDTYFIALTGNQNLVAGVSLIAPIFTLLVAFGDIFGLGGSSLIARLFGSGREEDAKRASAFCVWAAIAFGILVTLLFFLFRSQILTALGAEESTWQYAKDYYSWLTLGSVFILFGLVPSNILRTEGLATPAMIGSVMGSVINIILNPIFIFGLGKGAAGAAMATVIGNIAADIYYVYVMMKKAKRLSVSPRLCRIPANMAVSIFAIGIPACTTNLMQSFMIMMTNHFLLSYGTDKVAAMGIALKVNMITAFVLVGFAFGGQPLVGYNYGAKNQKRMKEILKFAYSFEIALALIFTVGVSLLAPFLIRIFMNEDTIVVNGANMLRCQQLGMTFMAIILVTTCICQSLGKAMYALILSISRQGIIYIIVIALFSHLLGYQGILLSQACSDLITGILAFLILAKLRKALFS
jgi:multidrug efflux pump